MGTYATHSQVQARAGNRVLTSTSKPSTDDVDAWIDEAEAELLGALRAAGISATYADGTDGFKVLRGWVGNYVAGLLRVSWAAAAGSGSNEDGQRQLTDWRDLLRRIGADPAHFSAMLGGGSASTESIGISSHIQDPVLGLTNDDYAPNFQSLRNDSRNY